MHFFTLRPDNFTLNWMHTHTVAAPSPVSVQVSMMCAIASALFYNPILALQSLAALMPDNQAIIQVFHLWLQVLDKHHKMFAKKQVSLDLVPSGALEIFDTHWWCTPLRRVVHYHRGRYPPTGTGGVHHTQVSSVHVNDILHVALSDAVTRTEYAV